MARDILGVKLRNGALAVVGDCFCENVLARTLKGAVRYGMDAVALLNAEENSLEAG